MGLGRGHRDQRSRLPRVLAAAAVLVLAVLAGLASLRVGPAPRIAIEPSLPGIGRRTPVVVRAEEPARGLASLKVELIQRDRATTLAERAFRPRPFWAFWGPLTAREELTLEVGKETVPALATGEATLRVTAGRAPTWLRRPPPVVVETTLPVRLSPPSLAVTSIQNNATQGGSGVVVYRLGPTAVKDGVRAGDWWFPGFPLPGGGEGERFCLYGAPYDLADPNAIRLVAEDDVGNAAETRFVERFTARPPTAARIELTTDFMARVVPEILSRTPDLADRGDLLANYLAVNGELRRTNAAELRRLAGESRPEFLWRQPFRQLPNTAVMASFADRRTYLFEDREVDHQDHLGFDLASRRHAPVEAGNRGVVVLADFFGIYGNTVVLDHGYGLASLYAHLSSIEVVAGQTVELGQVLGRTGETGLAGGDHLHFSILVHGLPVSPIEWWDGRWIRDHLAAKLGRAAPFAG